MDIEELRKEKQELEKDIAKKLNRLMEWYNVCVEDIDFEYTVSVSGKMTVNSVNIKISI